MQTIIALTSYKNTFGSKHFDQPYRSGMDKELLKKIFNDHAFNVIFCKMNNALNMSLETSETYFIYTSSEDNGYFYKSFIEDIVLGLKERDAKLLPIYKYLRANNNKVFMELLRRNTNNPRLNTIQSDFYGSLEELMDSLNKYSFPVVIKSSEGASGSGVFKAENISELIRVVKKISKTKGLKYDLKEYARKFKHKGYQRDSLYRKKYIIQNFIPDLKNDWKIYVFGNRYYVFYRPIFKHRGFRASGGGYDNYFYDEEAPKPSGLLDFAKETHLAFNTPHISMDIAFDGNDFHLIEFQFLYFGTAGIPYSKGYYINSNNSWNFINERLSIEKVYADSIVYHINKK